MEGARDPVLREAFLDGMSHAAATVNIVTTDGAAGRGGVTVSAMTSVSADTPRPTLLICVHRDAAATPMILENGCYCVNLLRDDQSFISDTFAGRFKEQFANKFDCADWAAMSTGAPRVVDPLVAFDCKVISSELVGTHHVLVGEVQDIFTASRGTPLIYANRAYGRTMRIDPITSLSTSDIDPALRIGCFHTFAPFFIPQIVERFARDDATDLRLTEGDHRRLTESVLAGETDLALVYDFDLPDELSVEPLTEVVPYILLAEDHPLADEPDLSMEKLAAAPMVLLESLPTSDYTLSLFAERGLTPKVTYHCPSFEMVRGLVGHGLGYSIMAAKPAGRHSYDGHALVTRPLPRDTRRPEIVIVSRKSAKLPAAADGFRAVCREIFG